MSINSKNMWVDELTSWISFVLTKIPLFYLLPSYLLPGYFFLIFLAKWSSDNCNKISPTFSIVNFNFPIIRVFFWTDKLVTLIDKIILFLYCLIFVSHSPEFYWYNLFYIYRLIKIENSSISLANDIFLTWTFSFLIY